MLMSDEQLKGYLPRYGDRLALRHFCSSGNAVVSGSNDDKKRKSSVLDRLRKKLCIPPPASASGCTDFSADMRQPPSRNACKPTRLIEVCWINITKGVGKKVKAADGGGVRKVSVGKNCKDDQLLSLATNLFFPNGMSKLGQLCEFSCKMLDFCQQPLKPDMTVGEMYSETKLPMLRFHLHTAPTDATYLSDDDSLPDLLHMICESEAGTISVNSDQVCNLTEDSSATENLDNVDISEDHVNDECDTDKHAEVNTHCVPERLVDVLCCLQSVNDECDTDKHDEVNTYCVPERLVDVLRCLESNIDSDGAKNIVNVIREDVLDGGFRGFMRKTFNPCHKLSVRFSGEAAIDDGGPTREFLRLALYQIEMKLFYGESNGKFLTLDADALENGTYEAAGRVMAYSLVHRGPLPVFMSEHFYAITICDSAQMDIGHLPDAAVPIYYREKLHKVVASECPESFMSSINDLADVIDIAGCGSLLRLDRKMQLVNTLKKFIVIDRVRPAAEQFLKGLSILGVLSMIRTYQKIMQEAFVYNDQVLDANRFEEAVDVHEGSWSPPGSNKRVDEERTYSYWLDYLLDLQDEYPDEGLKKLLVFITGTSQVPALGFMPEASVTFRHKCDLQADDPTVEFPVANTCANAIALPCSVHTYSVFKDRMQAAVDINVFTAE